MSQQHFDVEVALVYATPPALDRAALAECLTVAADEGADVLTPLTIAPEADPHRIVLHGTDLHATIQIHSSPLPEESFATALSAPLNGLKSFDYAGALARHTGGILITVGDGRDVIPSDARDAAGITPADPLRKLATLHLLMQALTELDCPLMVDFRPTMTLLSPEEYMPHAGEALPFRLLFHPFPEDDPTLPDGKDRLTITAFRSEVVLGKLLMVEGFPNTTPLDAMIDICGALVEHKYKGIWALEDGDTVPLGTSLYLHIRHEDARSKTPHGRIIARLSRAPHPPIEDPAPQRIYVAPTPAPAAQVQEPAPSAASQLPPLVQPVPPQPRSRLFRKHVSRLEAVTEAREPRDTRHSLEPADTKLSGVRGPRREGRTPVMRLALYTVVAASLTATWANIPPHKRQDMAQQLESAITENLGFLETLGLGDDPFAFLDTSAPKTPPL